MKGFIIIALAFIVISCSKETISYDNTCDVSTQTDSSGAPVYRICFPTSFSPNADGVNDLYYPVGSGIERNYSLEIFGRNKQRIYYTTRVYQGWNGTLASGPDIGPSGTYSYKVQFTDVNGMDHTYYGELTLIK